MNSAHDPYRGEFPPPPSSGSRISPAVLFVIVILAVIFFVSGFLHLLVRYLAKSRPSEESLTLDSHSLQRQLRQLFHLHDSGLDQSFIDSLPTFLYDEIESKEKDPFDCAVCLSEFSLGEKLRFLPICSHAFHLSCIDTWLLTNSTCPLCRSVLFVPGQAIENPAFEEDSMERRVFSVRLGKFRDVSGEEELGEASGSCLGRRCYSMGSYEYVVREPELRVEVKKEGEEERGKRIWAGSRDESLSVSKIWQWRKGKEVEARQRGEFGDL